MTREVLQERLAKVRDAVAQRQAAIREHVAQINALSGRDAELTELLALIVEPIPEADGVAVTD